jgi:hypothetical protein
MPQIVNCPDCGRKLRIPDAMLGKKVQCPSCCVKFKAIRVGDEPPEELEELEELEEVPEEAPRSTARRSGSRDERIGTRPQRSSRRDDDDDRPRSRRRRDDDDDDYPRSRRRRYDDDEDDEDDVEDERRGWQKVRYGIQLVAIGTWVWIVGTFLGGMLLLIALVVGIHAVSSLDSPSSSSSALASGGLALVTVLAGVGIMGFGNLIELILRAVGYGLCMATPSKRGTGLKPLAITAFVLVALDILFTVGRTFFNGFSSLAGSLGSLAGGQRGAGQVGGLIGLVLLLAGVASFVVFLFFLRSVCRHVRERRLGGQMITVLIVFLCYYLLSGVIIVVLVIATFGTAFFAASSGPQQGRLGNVADTLGTMGVVAVLVFSMIVLGNLGMHIWYISLMQKVRASIEAHRRDLLD